MVEIVFHGHACFEIKSESGTLITDPFLEGNPLADKDWKDIECDYILVSHGHGDHMGDALKIARATDATIIATYELASYCQAQGANAHAMHIGGGRQFDFVHIKLFPAAHGGMLETEDGVLYTVPCGFIIRLEDRKIYFAGDTGLISEMELLGRFDKIDVAILPIGDNFTMGLDDALIAVKLIQPLTVIPMHYNTFEVIQQNPEEFRDRVESETKSRCVVMNPGDRYAL